MSRQELRNRNPAFTCGHVRGRPVSIPQSRFAVHARAALLIILSLAAAAPLVGAL